VSSVISVVIKKYSIIVDELVKSPKLVTPANAGIQVCMFYGALMLAKERKTAC
jgi:hypothetical protein